MKVADTPAPSNLRPKQPSRVAVVIVMAALVAIAALPDYFNGNWPWTQPLDVAGLNRLKAIEEDGFELPGWSAAAQEQVPIGGEDWLLNEFRPANPEAMAQPSPPVVMVLTHVQSWHRDQPEVEWIDLGGSLSLQTESRTVLRFEAADQNGRAIPVTAQFLRSRNEQQTFAVLQWYAWANGGHFSPNRWFFADQFTQWRDRLRMPWLAVSVLMPIEPLDEIQSYEAFALDIGQAIQSALLEGPLADGNAALQ